jgi:hypothetical protein
MGLINNDEYTASNGVKKTGAYISFSNETIYINQIMGNPQAPTAPVYQVRANYRVFWDQAARQDGKTFLDLQPVSTQVPAAALGGNMYDLLYTVLKKKYPNTEDVHDPIPEVPTGATGLTGLTGSNEQTNSDGPTGTVPPQ